MTGTAEEEVLTKKTESITRSLIRTTRKVCLFIDHLKCVSKPCQLIVS